MDMKQWRQMLSGDNSSLKKEQKEIPVVTEEKKYRIRFSNGITTSLVSHDEAVRQINEWMNRMGWNWIRVTNENTKKTQIVREPSSQNNRGFLHLKSLNENMVSD